MNMLTRWRHSALLLSTLFLSSADSFVIHSTSLVRNAVRKNALKNDDEEEEEWHPRDPAHTIPQLLEGIWFQISQGKNMVKGESITVLYPQMEQDLNNPRLMHLLFGHLDVCKDVCDHFGITTTLTPYQPKKDKKIAGFTVKSFRDPASPAEGEKEFQFDYDPFWDDGTDFESLYDGIDEQDMVPDKYPPIETLVPDSDDEIIHLTKKWVNAVVSDMGVCPFAQSAERAGLPIGNVFYAVSRCSSFEDMYTAFWKEVTRLEQNDDKQVSTTLLIAPEFCLDNIELFDSFCNTLTQPLTALKIEDLLQLVFFHPSYTFRDGDARQTAAANYARRSPWPMINLLRTNQVRAAQKGIPTGLVYKQNEKTLSSIGVDSLETMLRQRNWEGTAPFKVNRKEVDALKMAQNFQETGKVLERDTKFEYDNTPAANKVNKEKQVSGGGNLVKVVMQALEKRLGKGGDGIAPLSGPITSATAMATDVLLDELYAMSTAPLPASVAKEDLSSPIVTTTTTSSSLLSVVSEAPWDGVGTPREIERARQLRLEAARRALLDDYNAIGVPQPETANPRGDPLQDALFGRGGIAAETGEDNIFPEGMDPRSFY